MKREKHMTLPNKHIRTITSTAERALTNVFDEKIRLGSVTILDSSPRSEVYRIELLEGPTHSPNNIIVKHVLERDGLVNEWAGVQFLTQVADTIFVAPTFYGGDLATSIVIMSDLGEGKGLDSYLLGHDPIAAEDALLKWATTLGKMHALTVGKQQEYEQICNILEPQSASTVSPYSELPIHFQRMIAAVNVELVPGTTNDLAVLTETMVQPGPFFAYTHGDPCPDNVILVDGQFKFLDFESGMFRHAMTDAIFARLNFPWCWCSARLPEHLPLLMEQVYRAELVKGCPEASDDALFFHALVDGCAAWLAQWDKWLPLAELLQADVPGDYVTSRQKTLFRLNTFVHMTKEYGHLEAMGETTQRVLVKLQERWSAELEAMPYYPAF